MGKRSTAKAPRRRTQEERSRSTRAALIGAAIECLLEAGYAATRMNDVAAKAGLSKGALQHHFADKRDLMVCVLEAGWADLVDGLRAISAIDGSIADRVDAVVDTMWNSYARPACRAAFEISYSGRSDPLLRAREDPLFLQVARTLDHEWKRVFADAPVDAERVRMSRRLARSLVHGVLMQVAMSPAPSDVEADLLLLKEVVRKTLTSPAPGPGPGPNPAGAPLADPPA